LQQIINTAKKYSDKILVVGFPGVDEAKTNPIAWADMNFKNDAIFTYEKAAQETCRQLNVPFIPLHQTFMSKAAQGQVLQAPDGLHPNDEGHQLIFELVRPELAKLLNG
jgi:lysophospholipase L1-like esterase